MSDSEARSRPTAETTVREAEHVEHIRSGFPGTLPEQPLVRVTDQRPAGKPAEAGSEADGDREVDLERLRFHDLYRLCTKMTEESSLGRLHERYAPAGVATIKYSLIGLFLLKMTGWVEIGWFWVLAPVWLVLGIAFLAPFILMPYLLWRRRRRARRGGEVLVHEETR